MKNNLKSDESPTIIATIANQEDASQTVDIVYLQDRNAFVSSGIMHHFQEKEILMPAHLVVSDLQLMGTIVAEILEKLSKARDRDSTFTYASRIEVMGTAYALEPYGDYMKLSKADG
ncbi:MAG: hypothetical protein R6U38_08015 [Desulfatiglandaceae bacterium]